VTNGWASLDTKLFAFYFFPEILPNQTVRVLLFPEDLAEQSAEEALLFGFLRGRCGSPSDGLRR
jgi:hypothetical protein